VGLTVASTRVYWTNSRDDTIAESDVQRGPRILVSGSTVGSPLGLTASGSHIYWANVRGNTIARANANGGDARILVRVHG
jgi:hypothetical protein